MKNELRLPSDIPEGLEYTPLSGLSGEEARRRLEAGKGNALPRDDGKPTSRIILGNVFTFFNLLNLGLAAALILVGSFRNMMFLGVVIANTCIAVFQELKARNTIRKLKLLHAPKARVIRDGKEQEIALQEAVEGDLMVLRSGDQAIADGIVRSGGGRAMEALLTGESDSIHKGEGNWVYSGSYLTEGIIA